MCSNSSKQWVTVRFLASQTASAHHTASPIFPVCSYLIKEQKNSPRRLGINLTEPTVQIFFKPACYPLTFSFLNVQGNVNNHRLYNLLDVYLNTITKKYNMSYCTDLQTVQKRKRLYPQPCTHIPADSCPSSVLKDSARFISSSDSTVTEYRVVYPSC